MIMTKLALANPDERPPARRTSHRTAQSLDAGGETFGFCKNKRKMPCNRVHDSDFTRQRVKMFRKPFVSLIFFLLFIPAAGAVAEDYGATARGLFTMLPASIFESTAEGLSEDDKQKLLLEGVTDFWEIAAESSDVLVFASLPFRERAIALRLFRNEHDGSTEVAVGTLGEEPCSLELWRLDSFGRLVPVESPGEPPVAEFLGAGRKLPRGIRFGALICMGNNGLKAVPQFWSSGGKAAFRVDNEINFTWNGREFEKRISPIK